MHMCVLKARDTVMVMQDGVSSQGPSFGLDLFIIHLKGEMPHFLPLNLFSGALNLIFDDVYEYSIHSRPVEIT